MVIDFNQYRKTTYSASITLTLNGVAPDIRSDTVTFALYNGAGAAVLSVNADVTSQGATGVALVSLTPTQMDIAPGDYTLEVVWARASGEVFVLAREKASVRERYSAV